MSGGLGALAGAKEHSASSSVSLSLRCCSSAALFLPLASARRCALPSRSCGNDWDPQRHEALDHMTCTLLCERFATSASSLLHCSVWLEHSACVSCAST